ncbi:MAG: hypothetical protein C4519_24940 [Desulfobacteraceae bacterium]|nr:MAG: hypothetical protein C4519_24940 [Desulfobacteraceae bacterium]
MRSSAGAVHPPLQVKFFGRRVDLFNRSVFYGIRFSKASRKKEAQSVKPPARGPVKFFLESKGAFHAPLHIASR